MRLKGISDQGISRIAQNIVIKDAMEWLNEYGNFDDIVEAYGIIPSVNRDEILSIASRIRDDVREEEGIILRNVVDLVYELMKYENK